MFYHCNYTSFTRQLQVYGFLKKGRTYKRRFHDGGDGQAREFSHERFKRNRLDLMKGMTGEGALKSKEFRKLGRPDLVESMILEYKVGDDLLANQKMVLDYFETLKTKMEKVGKEIAERRTLLETKMVMLEEMQKDS